MASSPLSNHSHSTLKAEYSSPESTRSFSQILPSASVQSTQEKTQYLSALRKSVVQLQGEVNEFLTAKMEEDKALAKGTGRVDDGAEEENYGEEGVEDKG